MDYKTKDGYFLETLEKELLNRGIQFERKSDDEIFYGIIEHNLCAEFYEFINLVRKFIEIFKQMLIDENRENYMFDKRINEIRNEEFKYICYSIDKKQEAECRIKALEFLREIYQYYQKYLIENHMIDYADMICLCYRQIIKEVKNKWPEINYKYIVVDEYQDITFQRFLFIKSVVKYFDAKLISVGDDWQSIYAFTGSRLEYFNKFKEYFLDAKDDLLISTTYRYGQELVDITSEFIKRNEEQSRKEIKAIKNLKEPIEICEYTKNTECEEINKLVHKLYKENPNANILILARTNDCLKQLGNSEYFTNGIDDILISKELPNAKIEALTMHRAKGITADQVIVMGLREKVFPSKGKIEHWIFEYFSLDYIEDEMPFAEERRLFYVALTRTRNKVYLVVPNKSISRTNFVNEIEQII